MMRRIIIFLTVFLIAFFVFGIGVIIWRGYRMARTPVFRTTLRNVTFVEKKDREFLQPIVDELEIREFQCFVFLGHPNRPTYEVILIGKANGRLEQSSVVKTYSLSDNAMTSIFHALKMSGANPKADDLLKQIDPCSFVYAYGDWLVIKEVMGSPTYLMSDDKVQVFLNDVVMEGIQQSPP